MQVKNISQIIVLSVMCAGCSDTELQSVDILDDGANLFGNASISDAEFRENEINGFVLSSIENFDRSGNLTLQANFVFNSDDLSISQLSLDDSGATIETFRFFLDERGLVSQINVLDESDDSVQTQLLERDAVGRLLRFESPEGDDSAIFEYGYENNRLVNRNQSFENDDQRIEGVFAYDTDGHLVSIAFTDSESNATTTIIYTNDEEGRPVRSEVGSLTDNIVDFTLTYLYDEFGNVIVLDRFDSLNALTSRRVFTYESVDLPIANILEYSLFYFP